MAERVYERLPLILDPQGGLLARVVESLTVLGHPPLYAGDIDEALDLARANPGRVGALIVPAIHARERWADVRKGLVEPLGLAPRSVLPVGAQLEGADARALHGDGLRWTLAGPFSPLELRFAVTMVLSESDPNELRLDTRVPCSIPVEVDSHKRVAPGQLTDLSSTGAFVALAHPHQEGTPLTVRGKVCGRPVSLQARVVWRTGSAADWRDRGMGIAFERIELAALELVRREIDRALDRFRIRVRATS